MDLKLKGKKVLVTGGSKGIGKGIAQAFLEEGADVAILGRGLEALQSAKKELPELEIIQADVTNEEERLNAFQTFLTNFGTIDVLVNNAGGSSGGKTMETTVGQFEEAMLLNYFSAVHLSQLAVREMKKHSGGAIVNISSIFGRESGGKPTYNSAKAAMISTTKSLADEVIKDGIRVNSIAPGAILHPTGNWQKKLEENPDKINKFVEAEIPAGRFGTVEEVANAVVFLASEKASWIVGASINVDGGQSKSNF